MAALPNLPKNLTNRILAAVDDDRASAMFRLSSSSLRDRDRDQVLLNRLNKLLSFLHARWDNVFHGASYLTLTVHTDQQGCLESISATADPNMFECNQGQESREHILRKVAALSHRISSLRITLNGWAGADFEEVVLEFPAPSFQLPELQYLA